MSALQRAAVAVLGALALAAGVVAGTITRYSLEGLVMP